MHVLGHPQLPHQPLEGEPVLLAPLLDDLGVGLPGDQVDDVRVVGDDLGERPDGDLDALSLGDQPEGRQNLPTGEPGGRSGCGVEAGKEFDRRAVRNHPYAGGGNQAGIDDDAPRCFGEHGDESCSRRKAPAGFGPARERVRRARCAG